MRSRAVILTYPGHFLLTALTLKTLKQHIPQVKEIIIIVDDTSILAWPSYVDDCKQLYQHPTIQVSNFRQYVDCFGGDGWVRQQIIKMMLDKIVPWDQFFFSDGDIMFKRPVPNNITPYAFTQKIGVPLEQRDPLPGELDSQVQNYVQHLLGIPYAGLQVDQPTPTNYSVSTSGVPFRDIDTRDLVKLRNYVENRFQKNFVDVHVDIFQDTRYSISEWELIEYFRQQVLKQPLKTQHYPPYPYDVDDSNQPYCFSTCWCADRELFDRNWWHAQDIAVSEDMWNQLPLSKF